MNENLKKILKKNEEVQWMGQPEKTPLLAGKTGKSIITRWILCVVLAVALTAVYWFYCDGHDGTEFNAIMLIFTIGIPVAIAWSPIGENNKLNKLHYVITDQRIIMYHGEINFSMCRSHIKDIRVRKLEDGTSAIYIGKKAFDVKDSKIRYIASHGISEHINDENVTVAAILYKVKDADKICKLIADGAKVETVA